MIISGHFIRLDDRPTRQDVSTPGAPQPRVDAPRVVMARPVNNNEAYEDGLALKVKTRTKKPSMYKVLLLNDDFTPMEFVVYVLERVFRKSRVEANDIMLQVHQDGVGVAGIFTYEVAETKVDQVMSLARKNEHPLQCTMERDD